MRLEDRDEPGLPPRLMGPGLVKRDIFARPFDDEDLDLDEEGDLDFSLEGATGLRFATALAAVCAMLMLIACGGGRIPCCSSPILLRAS